MHLRACCCLNSQLAPTADECVLQLAILAKTFLCVRACISSDYPSAKAARCQYSSLPLAILSQLPFPFPESQEMIIRPLTPRVCKEYWETPVPIPFPIQIPPPACLKKLRHHHHHRQPDRDHHHLDAFKRRLCPVVSRAARECAAA